MMRLLQGWSAAADVGVGVPAGGLETAETLEQVGRFPGWKLHPRKGDLKGLWSLTVTGNRRLIFDYDEKTNTASEIDLIDYH
jgi:toxin HigB-1